MGGRKAFYDLDKQELHYMRRKRRNRFPLDKFISDYGISICEYQKRMRELGFILLREERISSKGSIFVKEEDYDKRIVLTKYEMMAIRLFRGYDRFQLAKLLNANESTLRAQERGKGKPSVLWQKRYIQTLKIKYSEVSRIRAALSNKSSKIEIDRAIPPHIKEEVRKRDNNQCAKCDSTEKLHFHHIKKYSDGGLHAVDNLILLCPDCHAEEHAGETCYSLLKSMANSAL